jgi:putative ABC transport system ATP-binding protein
MSAYVAEPVVAAAGMAVAAGRHGHLVKLAGLLIIGVAVVVGAGLAATLVIRRSRSGPAAGWAGGRRSPNPQPAAPAAAIATEHLTKIYQMGKVAVRALNDVSLAIPAGSMVCIMGRSGSGKSTLLRQLGLMDLPSEGRIWLHGQEVTALTEHQRVRLRLRSLGYVFQEYALLPELTAAENVYMSAMMVGKPGRQCRTQAADLLDLVGLGSRAGHRPKELSGGEQQRVAIARALVNEPRIIFADEPTANLDMASARTVMETLQKLNEALGVTVVFVSHDPDDAQYAAQIVRLSDGRIGRSELSGAQA